MGKWHFWYGLLGLAGFSDTLYLTFSHYRQHTLGCSILDGCDEVLTSEYSEIAGIPLALFGAAYYLMLVTGTIASYQTGAKRWFSAIFLINSTGFIVSLVLVYVQWAVILAFCQYCVLSAAITSVMLVILLFALRNNRQEQLTG
ncbi:MAG: vitamin K epoxide reductase family protein [Rhodothermaceae bacterium]|nr:vitamin K epoxide reductase family protein [Rhodothermaceae bacterium]